MMHDDHQWLREMLGSFALGHLGPQDAGMLRAHLDGCAACRADLDEIVPLAELLDRVDPTHFALPPFPPAGLGEAIRTAVASERVIRADDDLAVRRASARRRALTRLGLTAAAVALVGGSLATGLALGRDTAPSVAPAPPAPPAPTSSVPAVPLEQVSLQAVTDPALSVATAGLVAHTWGVELRMTATGFTSGEVYQAAFRDRATGDLVMAGAFIGTGSKSMTCNLQSGLMRDEASQVVILDDAGDVVLTAAL